MRMGHVFLVGLAATGAFVAGCGSGSAPVSPPGDGLYYHGVYPGGLTGEEDDITPADVDAYESLAGQPVAWVYFSHNWYHGRAFPLTTATWIRARGAVPFIRLMPRSTPDRGVADPAFRLQAILQGDFDADLRGWASAAAAFGTRLLVEFGTECNGEWFPWNGRWHGGGETAGFGDPRWKAGCCPFPGRWRGRSRRPVRGQTRW